MGHRYHMHQMISIRRISWYASDASASAGSDRHRGHLSSSKNYVLVRDNYCAMPNRDISRRGGGRGGGQ